MKLLAYSERGMTNSLLYNIYHSDYPNQLLSSFLSIATFPYHNLVNFEFVEADILLEQSFSDFGDPDAVLLLNTGTKKISVFVEAKVGKKWDIHTQFTKFIDGTTTKVSSSNIFTQFYHKVRLVNALKENNQLETLTKGIQFPLSSTKKRRKIGSNEVVRKSAKLLSKYLDESYYLAILPTNSRILTKFYEETLKLTKVDYPQWNITNYGFISWEQIENFAGKNKLHNVLDILDHNKGQIY